MNSSPTVKYVKFSCSDLLLINGEYKDSLIFNFVSSSSLIIISFSSSSLLPDFLEMDSVEESSNSLVVVLLFLKEFSILSYLVSSIKVLLGK